MDQSDLGKVRMIEDICVEENFITEHERLSIRQRVLDLEPCWTTHRPEHYSNVDFSTLGNALYIMEASGHAAQDIDQQIRALLLENFDWLYQRIYNKIAQHTGRPTRLHDSLTVPGFHIGHVAQDSNIDFYHQDLSILQYDVEANMETNRSVLIAIDKPSSGAYLDYLHEDNTRTLDYVLGAWHQWDARIKHKVGGLKINPGEHRITLQCHYYYNARMQCNLVYF